MSLYFKINVKNNIVIESKSFIPLLIVNGHRLLPLEANRQFHYIFDAGHLTRISSSSLESSFLIALMEILVLGANGMT